MISGDCEVFERLQNLPTPEQVKLTMAETKTSETESVDLFAPAAAPRWLAGFLALGAVLGVAGWLLGFLDPIVDSISPERVEVTGRVTFNGEPLKKGLVQTKSEIKGRMGGLGEIKEDGTFALRTNGDPGVFTGKHRFTVSYMTSTFPPVSLLPDEYFLPEKTPFRFTVRRGKPNQFDIVMVGTMKGSAPISEAKPVAPSETEQPAKDEIEK
jgi:hypothetical protein